MECVSSWQAVATEASSVAGDGAVDCEVGRLCGSSESGGSTGRGDGMEGNAKDAGFGVGMADVRTRSGLLIKLVGYNEARRAGWFQNTLLDVPL